MAKINLLDWRQELRERRRRQFFAMLVLSALAGLVIVLGAVAVMNSAVTRQTERNEFLRAQIVDLDKQIVEIQELEKVRAKVVNTLPEGVFLTSLKQTGDQVAIDGVAESNGRISTYMKNLENSQWFAEPQLIVIRTVESNKRRQSQFSLKVKNLTTAKLIAAQDPDMNSGGGDGSAR
jgi:type IV pilus assembly protein PilN